MRNFSRSEDAIKETLGVLLEQFLDPGDLLNVQAQRYLWHARLREHCRELIAGGRCDSLAARRFTPACWLGSTSDWLS
ncbi:MAG: hypothetical protein ACOVP8_00410, partial [Phycisphaerales bacterium]